MLPIPTAHRTQAAAFLEDAAVLVRRSEHVARVNVSISHTGGYGVWLAEGTRHSELNGCALSDLGAGGVRIGSNFSVGSMTRQPKAASARSTTRPSSTATGLNVVLNTSILGGGRVYPEGVGILIQRSKGNRISGCEIGHMRYTGVSLGWEWGYKTPSGAGNNSVVGNYIHHIGDGTLADMGGVYVLGRSEGSVIEGNVIAFVIGYHMYSWGVRQLGSNRALAHRLVVAAHACHTYPLKLWMDGTAIYHTAGLPR
jgi:hypothetical protein